MNLRLLLPSFAALAGLAAVLVLRAGAQQPASEPAPSLVEVPRVDNTIVRPNPDGKTYRLVQIGPNTEFRQEVVVGQTGPNTLVPHAGYGGRTMYGVVGPLDAESQKLLAQEQAAAQEARALATQAQQGDSEGAKADAKKKLREKLVQIFDGQQERRNREIAKIEERLGKLKDTLKKRDAAKDSIVDRRLETLTGGVDELGWEDSFGNPGNPYAQPRGELHYPPPVPVPHADPRFAPPVPVAPRAGAGPAYAVPELPPSLDPTPPAPARAPFAPAAPAPPGAPALPALPSPGR